MSKNWYVTARSLRISDAVDCADWLQSDDGDDARVASSVSGPTLQLALRRGIESERLKGIVIEANTQGGTAVTGFAVSGFVASSRFSDHLAAPSPFLFRRLLFESLASGGTFLGPQAIAVANGSVGLDLCVQLVLKSWQLDEEPWKATALVAHQAYVQHHVGYRLNRVLQEDWDRGTEIYLTAGYRRMCSFACAGGRMRHVYYADQDTVKLAPPGSTVSFVMRRAVPRCRFSRAEQQLLTSAIAGLTDGQIADEADKSLNTIKTQWRSIYGKVETYVPHILRTEARLNDATRGAELRRSVIAFAAAHPEELRPFSTGPGD